MSSPRKRSHDSEESPPTKTMKLENAEVEKNGAKFVDEISEASAATVVSKQDIDDDGL